MTLSEMIKEYRISHNLSQRAFATRCGITNAHISLLEQGKNPKTGKPMTPTLPMLKKIAGGMGITIDELLAEADDFDIDLSPNPAFKKILPLPPSKKYRVLGTIACGTPIEAVQESGEEFDFPEDVDADADVCLRCAGDSMLPVYRDGDIVFIRRQPQVENGQIAAVYVKSGSEWDVTLKKVILYPDRDIVVLRALNPDFEDMIFTGEERSQLEVYGLAVALYRKT